VWLNEERSVLGRLRRSICDELWYCDRKNGDVRMQMLIEVVMVLTVRKHRRASESMSTHRASGALLECSAVL